MHSTPVDTIVFDLGGVLIDWNPDYVYREIYPDPDERKWFYDNICTHEWNLLQDAGRSLQEATEEKVAEFPAFDSQIRAFYGRWEEMLGGAIEESVTILDRVRSRKDQRIFALTNWSHETFPVALDRFNFLQWFEGIVVSGHERTIKPLREIYQILLSRYHIHAEKAVFIDDNHHNVIGAREAGLRGIHFTNPAQLEEELIKLDVLS